MLSIEISISQEENTPNPIKKTSMHETVNNSESLNESAFIKNKTKIQSLILDGKNELLDLLVTYQNLQDALTANNTIYQQLPRFLEAIKNAKRDHLTKGTPEQKIIYLTFDILQDVYCQFRNMGLSKLFLKMLEERTAIKSISDREIRDFFCDETFPPEQSDITVIEGRPSDPIPKTIQFTEFDPFEKKHDELPVQSTNKPYRDSLLSVSPSAISSLPEITTKTPFSYKKGMLYFTAAAAVASGAYFTLTGTKQTDEKVATQATISTEEITSSTTMPFESPPEKDYQCTFEKNIKYNKYINTLCDVSPETICNDYKKAANHVLVSCKDLVSEDIEMRKIVLLQEYLKQIVEEGQSGSKAIASSQLETLEKYRL
ncbi:hypothetical protein GF340_05650, partial [Candidatus Peregrinibacteria bacterium]|nr:hypothetical protein [Candidatus Peregrinibacteria bacterium]